MKISYVGELGEYKSKGDVLSLSKKGKSAIPVVTPEQAKNLIHLFKFLNDKDRDILYLIFITRLKQSSVQKIMRRSQPSLCYDIKRIRQRLQFINYIYQIVDIFYDFLEKRSSMYDTEDVEVLALMFYTTSLTLTAKVLKCKQIKIRYRLDKVLKQMESYGHWDVYEIFAYIRHNLNIVRRIYKNQLNCN